MRLPTAPRRACCARRHPRARPRRDCRHMCGRRWASADVVVHCRRLLTLPCSTRAKRGGRLIGVGQQRRPRSAPPTARGGAGRAGLLDLGASTDGVRAGREQSLRVPTRSRRPRLRHSHIPWDTSTTGCALLNPAPHRPSEPTHGTYMTARWRCGVHGLELQALPPRAPRRSGQEVQPDTAIVVVDVEVDQADALPRAEREAPTVDRHARVGRHEARHDVRAAVSRGAVPMSPPVVGGQQVGQRREQVVVRPGPGLDDGDAPSRAGRRRQQPSRARARSPRTGRSVETTASPPVRTSG